MIPAYYIYKSLKLYKIEGWIDGKESNDALILVLVLAPILISSKYFMKNNF